MDASQKPKITVHWLNNSRAHRILWLLEELKLEYELKKYERNPTTQRAPKELTQIHPLGKSPIVEIEENGKSIKLAESGAIVEFLTEKYDTERKLCPDPSDAEKRSQYLFWLHYAEGSAMLPLMVSVVASAMPKQANFLMRPLLSAVGLGIRKGFSEPELSGHLKLISSTLSQGPYFLGQQFTADDIMMSFPMESIAYYDSGKYLKQYPVVREWKERTQQREAWKRWWTKLET